MPKKGSYRIVRSRPLLLSEYSISVVIPTFNSDKTIGKCLKSLECQSFRPHEIIVADGRSSDSTVNVARSFQGVNVLINHRSHFPGSSRNLGVKGASGKYVFFIDSDCVANRRALEYHAKAYETRGRIQGVQGVIRSSAKGAFASLVQRQFTTNYWVGNLREDGTTRLLAPSGNNISLERDVLLANPFSEALSSCDDIELMIKLRRVRCRVFFEPRAVVYHRHPRSPLGRFRQWKWYGPGFCGLCKKYPRVRMRRNSISGTSRRYVRWSVSRLQNAVLDDNRGICSDCPLGVCAINVSHLPISEELSEAYLRQMTCLGLAAGVLGARNGTDFDWSELRKGEV